MTISLTRRYLPQVLACSAKNFLLLQVGMLVALPTLIIPKLLLHDSTESFFTTSQASWFASIMYIFQPIGAVSVNIFLDPFGRKLSMLGINIPMFIVLIILARAESVPIFYIASAIMGTCIGFLEAPVLTYIGEISEPEIRGILTSYSEMMINVGILVVYFCGALLDWRETTLLSSIIPIIALVSIYLIPESPIWLVSKGRIKEAEASLCWLRGWVKPSEIKDELEKTINYYNERFDGGYIFQEPVKTVAEIVPEKQATSEEKGDDDSSVGSKESIDEFDLARVGRLVSIDLQDGKICGQISCKETNRETGGSSGKNVLSEKKIISFFSYKEKESEEKCDGQVKFEISPNTGSPDILDKKQPPSFYYNIKQVKPKAGRKARIKERVKYFFRREVIHPLILMLVYFFFNVFSGKVTITPYEVLISKALHLRMDPFKINVMFSLATAFGSLICLLLIRWMGKRLLSLMTYGSLAVISITLGYYILSPVGQAHENAWIPYYLLLLVHLLYGLTIIPWLYLSEVFPFRARGLASSLMASMYYIYGFFATKLYFHIVSWTSLSGLFILFGVINTVAFIFIYIFVIETEGKSLEEIESLFQKKKIKT